MGNQDSDPGPLQYSIHRSEIITDIAIILSLRLTQEFIPLNKDSQRLFPDEINSLDDSIRDSWHTKSDNFLNGSTGSLYTPLTTGIIITGLNLVEDAPSLKIGNELFIFANGAFANKFLTKIFKRALSRRRPLLEFASPDEQAELGKDENNHEAFYSGHTSTAFYSAAFLRRRLSQSLQRRGHTGIKSGHQWLAGVTLYMWAAYVGYSRIEIDEHYFTDVVTGAVMGVLFEEIYYRFNQRHWSFHPSWRLTPQVRHDSLGLWFARSFP
ncbi:phosphatase PAP2 family protein [Candidatus Poribacteria bacterium]